MTFLPLARFRFRLTLHWQPGHLSTSLPDDAHFDDRFSQPRQTR
jgi:hypothetical protein